MPKSGRFSRCSFHYPLLNCGFFPLRLSDRRSAQSLGLSR